MADLLKHYLLYSFHSMTKYDYMAIGWVLFLSILFLILAAFVRRRGATYFLLFLGLVLLFFGPPMIKVALDNFIRAAEVETTKVKPLKYSRSLLLEGNLTNRGRIDFSSCDLVVSLYRPNTPLKEWAAYLKPFRVAVVAIEAPLTRGETKPFRVLVDDFRVEGDFNATLFARCYP
jgi:hypothetical protein